MAVAAWESLLNRPPVWLFAYGSLMWRPGFRFLDRTAATAPGWSRRFWQGSHDHRGTPLAPGRVVTLVDDASAGCAGVAYRMDPEVLEQTFEVLDHREKNGYGRATVRLQTPSHGAFEAIAYLALPDNPAWLGDAPLTEMAAQIAASCGPSGTNPEYLFGLANALRTCGIVDEHVFGLEQAVRQLTADPVVIAGKSNGQSA